MSGHLHPGAHTAPVVINLLDEALSAAGGRIASSSSSSSSPEVENEEEEQQLFSLYTTIVGKRFYRGKMNQNEIVHLRREPSNPYDQSAIRVDSITNQQVGHVSAKSSYPNNAEILSKVVDKYFCTLEAVSTNIGDTFKSEIEVTIVGLEKRYRDVFKLLKDRQMPFFDIKNNCAVNGYYKRHV